MNKIGRKHLYTTRDAQWFIAIPVFALGSMLSPQVFGDVPGYNALWDGSTGVLPDSACPAWELVDDAQPEEPRLSEGILTLETHVAAQDMWYRQRGAAISVPDPLVIEAVGKLASPSSGVSFRAPDHVRPHFFHFLSSLPQRRHTSRGSDPCEIRVHWWCSKAFSTGSNITYDLPRGSVSELPVGPGASEVCIASEISVNTASDPDSPSLGEAFWYLARARNSCGVGSYGFETNGMERTTAECP